MEFTEEFVKEHQLNEAQIAAIKTFGTDYIAGKQKEWDDKIKEEGNKYANGILDGSVASIEKETGVKLEKGEKVADYLKRAVGGHLAVKQTELDKLKADLEEKIKTGAGDEALKQEISALKTEVDRLKKVEAEFEPLKGVKEQYDNLEKQYGSLKLETAFGKARPAFPEAVNPYEADAKWNAFKNSVLEKYEIEIVDGDAIAIEKENKYKQIKLSELAAKDTTLSELTKGRQQPGSGTTDTTPVTIEGVPFKLPENATSEQISTSIKEYLVTEKKFSVHSKEYSEEFAKFHKKIHESRKK